MSVGRVMTCALGMVVRREREIRNFVKTPFYRVLAKQKYGGRTFEGEWRAVEGSGYFQSPLLYKENGFKKKEDAQDLVKQLEAIVPREAAVEKAERKKELKNPPLLYNLAELQNECSKLYKISPDQTLSVVQELYEKKLVTYPRTDARVLSSAVAREIQKNIRGLTRYEPASGFASEILEKKPTGISARAATPTINRSLTTTPSSLRARDWQNLSRLSELSGKVYGTIVRRFLSIFYPPAVYQKISLVSRMGKEAFFSSFKVLAEEGYLKVAGLPQTRKKEEGEEDALCGADFLQALSGLKKGSVLPVEAFRSKKGRLLRPSGTIPVP